MSYTANEYKIINEKLHDEIYSLTKQIKIMRDALNEVENYLNWRIDDLVGDDLIGDRRHTNRYNELMVRLGKALKQAEEV